MPFLKEEKSEHERALRAGESYLTPLRATLRDPPSKWAIKGLFPECRAAGFLLHTFLSAAKEKCERPLGRRVPLPRRSRRVRPRKRGSYSHTGYIVTGRRLSAPAPLRTPNPISLRLLSLPLRKQPVQNDHQNRKDHQIYRVKPDIAVLGDQAEQRRHKRRTDVRAGHLHPDDRL